MKATMLCTSTGREPSTDVSLGGEAHERGPPIHAIVRMYQIGNWCLEVILAHHLSSFLVSHFNLAILPASNELGNPVVIQVEAVDAIHAILRLYSPCSRQLVVDSHSAVHECICEATLVKGFHAHDDIRLRDLFQYFLLLESSDLEIFGSAKQLRRTIIINITEGQGTHVVACDSPVDLIAFVVECLHRAVSTYHTDRLLDGWELTVGDDVDTVMNFLEEEICILLHIIDHERCLGAHHQHVSLNCGI
mmetsp:Transcript_89835/g.159799  ORF Transcript_89835/g.159799 Transcript_89835/m.159799 type:complete len:248 (+) Transcript_89835:1278-2021(+)